MNLLPVFRGFDRIPVALPGGRGWAAGKCDKSGAVLRWAGHEKAGAKQKPASELPWKGAISQSANTFPYSGAGATSSQDSKVKSPTAPIMPGRSSIPCTLPRH